MGERMGSGGRIAAGVLMGLAAWFGFAGLASGQARSEVSLRPPFASDLLAPPAIVAPQMSPDGRRLAYVRQSQADEPSGAAIVTRDLTQPGAPVVAYMDLPDRKVAWAAWANNDRLLISFEFTNEVEGRGVIMLDDEGEWRLFREVVRRQIFAVNTDGSNPVPLFDFSSRQFNSLFNLELDNVIDFLPDDPNHVLIPASTGRRGRLSVYRVNVNNGEAELVARGSRRTVAWFTNGRGTPVMRWELSSSGRNVTIMVREGDGARWRRVARSPVSEFGRLNEDYTWVARSERYDEALVFARSPETGTLGLFRYALAGGALTEPIFLHPAYDVARVAIDPFSGRLLALHWADEVTHVEVFDPDTERYVRGLTEFFGEGITVTPLQRAGDNLLISASGPLEPESFYVFDFAAAHVTPIEAVRPGLHNRALAPVRVHRYQARDGTPLFGYVTWPAVPASDPPPLVVMPHGGPERRDYLGFDVLAQLVAAEGFAVFQPQFRGSSGFGQAFAEAGYGEMGGLIQSDITDGVQDLIATGAVRADRVCVAGWSFGGYSALMQAILEPELYQCAFAGAPVTDLPALLDWHRDVLEDGEVLDYVERLLGHPDRERMVRFSPARRAAEIRIPVLLLHGRDDEIVPFEQSELMQDVLAAAGVDSTLFPFAGGHSPALDDELVTVAFHMGRFLSDHLDRPAPSICAAAPENHGNSQAKTPCPPDVQDH